MRCKAKIGSKAQRTREYVSISNRFSTPQRAAVGPVQSFLSAATAAVAPGTSHERALRRSCSAKRRARSLGEPIIDSRRLFPQPGVARRGGARRAQARSEEHTSELQSRENLVCRLLLEKKKQ